MNNNKIYRKLTIKIQNKIAKFKEGRSTKSRLNDQLVLIISSLCRFLRKKEEQKIKEEKKEKNVKNEKYTYSWTKKNFRTNPKTRGNR